MTAETPKELLYRMVALVRETVDEYAGDGVWDDVAPWWWKEDLAGVNTALDSISRLTRERDAAMGLLRRWHRWNTEPVGDPELDSDTESTITAIETGAIHDA